MPVYSWKARTRQGAVKKGVMEAQNDEAVMGVLRAQSLLPIAVKPASRDLMEFLPDMGSPVSTRELVVFTRQFSTMIDAGLPLVQCLDILGDQEPNKKFKDVLMQVKSEVEQGATFADALSKHPKVFDELYVNLVQAGEIGGILDTILNRLGTYLEKADSLTRKVKSAMVYHITIMVVAIGVLVMLMVKVIPVFEKMFADFGGTLPGPTQMVVNISHWLQANLVFLMVGTFLFYMAFSQARARIPAFRYHTDAIALKLPVFGNLLRKSAVARFSRTFGTMISSGVPILDSLQVVAKTAGNKVIEKALMTTRSAISEGRTLAEPLAESKIFPGMVVQMIAVGEQTGAMDTMLNKIADFYEDEVDAAVDALTAMLEPLMMVFLGGSVGSILIAMYLPIFKIAETIR
ncbi:MAG: type II secretion system F family protein [Deltaproteobacteria bacterium]|nr:type II secretion system F family protein [Deltaproteobacteria bacterium]